MTTHHRHEAPSGYSNKPMPETATGLDAEEVPETIAYVFIFGKETDRPARLQLLDDP